VQFSLSALEVLSKPALQILKIADFNTTGLILGGKDDRTYDWFKLTKSVGVSDKNAGKLGSFRYRQACAIRLLGFEYRILQDQR